jgi:ribonuclease BN (tRNA processing enzyme)
VRSPIDYDWGIISLIRARVLYSKSAIGTQILLTQNDRGSSFLVDVGDGTLRDLAEAHFHFDTLKGILITHEHADHTGGLFSLLHFLKHIPHPDPIYILSPKPITYLRYFLEKPLMYSKIPFKVILKEVDESTKVKIDAFEVSSFRAAHVDFESIGYSIRDCKDGFRVVVSGDTMASQELTRRVKGADLAILESTFEDGQEKFAKAFGHMTTSQAKKMGRLAKKAILVHQMPQEYFKIMTCAVIPSE